MNLDKANNITRYVVGFLWGVAVASWFLFFFSCSGTPPTKTDPPVEPWPCAHPKPCEGTEPLAPDGHCYICVYDVDGGAM